MQFPRTNTVRPYDKIGFQNTSIIGGVTFNIFSVTLAPVINIFFNCNTTPEPEYVPTDSRNFDGHRYAVYDVGLTWHEAKEYCENIGGHLATITSEAEQDFIENLAKKESKKFYWLGATDEEIEGEWKWITGEEWNYTNWATGEPSNCTGYFGYNEDYLAMDMNYYIGKWNDLPSMRDDYIPNDWSLNVAGFVCEFTDKNE